MSTPATSHISPGYPVCCPYLIADGAAKAIEFYTTVFGAKERMRMPMKDGRVGHAELEIEGSLIMIADEFPDCGIRGPKSIGGSPVTIVLYVPDVDAFVKRAEQGGAVVNDPPKNQFYGDRSARITDPFGHVWSIATHVEDVSPEEMQQRAAEVLS